MQARSLAAIADEQDSVRGTRAFRAPERAGLDYAPDAIMPYRVAVLLWLLEAAAPHPVSASHAKRRMGLSPATPVDAALVEATQHIPGLFEMMKPNDFPGGCGGVPFVRALGLAGMTDPDLPMAYPAMVHLPILDAMDAEDEEVGQ